jgi:hypothetical protein
METRKERPPIQEPATCSEMCTGERGVPPKRIDFKLQLWEADDIIVRCLIRREQLSAPSPDTDRAGIDGRGLHREPTTRATFAQSIPDAYAAFHHARRAACGSARRSWS